MYFFVPLVVVEFISYLYIILKNNHFLCYLYQNEGLFVNTKKNIQLIKKDNRLIEAKYRLSIHQQRVLYTLLEKIHSSDDDFMHYDIDIGDSISLLTASNRSISVRITAIFEFGIKDLDRRWVYLSLRSAQ